MSSVDYTPCPHCGSNNLPGRQLCWQCGKLVPLALGPDGLPCAVSYQDQHSQRKADIEALLAQATTLDLQGKELPVGGNAHPAQSQKSTMPPTPMPRVARTGGLWPWKRRQPET